LRTKEQGKYLTHNEHHDKDDDDDEVFRTEGILIRRFNSYSLSNVK